MPRAAGRRPGGASLLTGMPGTRSGILDRDLHDLGLVLRLDGHSHLEEAVLAGGGHLVNEAPARKSELAYELAELELRAVVLVLLVLLLLGAVQLDAQGTLGQREACCRRPARPPAVGFATPSAMAPKAVSQQWYGLVPTPRVGRTRVARPARRAGRGDAARPVLATVTTLGTQKGVAAALTASASSRH